MQHHTLEDFIIFMSSWKKLGFGKHSGGCEREREMRGKQPLGEGKNPVWGGHCLQPLGHLQVRLLCDKGSSHPPAA